MFWTKTLTRAIPVFLMIVIASTGLRAELKVDITKGKAEPLPIAVTDFFGSSAEEAQDPAQAPHSLWRNLSDAGQGLLACKDCGSSTVQTKSGGV